MAYEQQFQADCLREHNRLRALHGCPPLKLNKDICKISKQWANTLAACNKFEHNANRGKYGENILMFSEGSMNGTSGTKIWYDEIKSYNFNRPGFGMNTGHFTQVIWKGTKEMGVAIAKGRGNVYVVANYSPPGNVANCFTENVPRKIA